LLVSTNSFIGFFATTSRVSLGPETLTIGSEQNSSENCERPRGPFAAPSVILWDSKSLRVRTLPEADGGLAPVGQQSGIAICFGLVSDLHPVLPSAFTWQIFSNPKLSFER
jgi:hypothetical protein